MRINTNLTAMNTFTQYTANNNKISNAVAKLSSGYAINTAADNAAGLAISEKMRAQIRGLTKASANAQDAISLVQTAEGSLGEATEILQRMRELAVQASSDTNENAIDRDALQDEFAQLQNELNDIASTTTFNKKNLLDGSLAASQRSVKINQLANSSMAVSVGKAAAGTYTFSVVTRMENADIAAKKGEATAAMGSTASATFSAFSTSDLRKEGALYNGNYTLETSIKDGNLTVAAKGDNGQTFYATIDVNKLDSLEKNWATLADDKKAITLSFESGSGANDGFDLTLNLSAAPSTSENGKLALKDAIDDVTISIDGGVNAQSATYGVYATVTGGEAVKLNAGDNSVTFSNGITVSFDKLTATDVQVAAGEAKSITGLTAPTVTPATVAGTKTNFTVDLKDIVTDYNKGDVKTYTVNVGGLVARYKTTGEETDNNAVIAELVKVIKDAGTTGPVTTRIADDSELGTAAFEYASDASGVVTFASTAALNTADAPTLAKIDSPTLTATVQDHKDVKLSDGILGKVADETKSTISTFDVVETAGKGLTFQVGANLGDEMVINLDSVNSQSLGINSAKVTTQEAASAAIQSVDNAINKVSSQRAYLGAIQNRLDYKINNLETSTQNLTSAESQIRDVDMAKEMTAFTNANILQQAATAMLAQANSLPQNVLSLIRG